MKFLKFFFAAATILLASPALAFWHGINAGLPVSNSFTSLKTCGGGFIVGADVVQTTGVRFGRTDVAFGYIWGTSDNKWHNLITKTSMPAANFGVYPTTGSTQHYLTANQGILDIAGAPSDSTVAYMVYAGKVFRSTNVSTTSPDSITWTDTGFSAITNWDASFTNGRWKHSGPRLAVDPNNKNHVLFGTMENGVWETTNGLAGTPTWTQISTAVLPLAVVPSSNSGDNPAYNIVFDPASGVNGSSLTNAVYIFTPSASNSGVYRTVNGNTANLALTTGGPTTALQVIKSQKTGNVIWAVDNAGFTSNDLQWGTLWKFVTTGSGLGSGTWSQVLVGNGSNAGYHSVAINPNNTNHIVALDPGGGNLRISTDGSTWTSVLPKTTTAGDAPYLSKISTALSSADIFFDPLQTDVLLYAGGQGFWTAPLPSTTTTYAPIVNGVEEFIAEWIVVPSTNKVLIGGQDLGLFYYDAANNNCLSDPYVLMKSVTNNGLERAQIGIPPGVSNFAVAKNAANFGTGLAPDYSGTSTDNFVSNLVPFNSWNATVNSGTGMASDGSGTPKVKVTTSTTGLTTWSGGSGSIVCAVTYNKSATQSIDGLCSPITVNDSTHFTMQNLGWDATLNSSPSDYLLWVPTAPQSDYRGQLTIKNVDSNGGEIRITPLSNPVQTNNIVCITGVSGVPANGCWIAKSVTGTSFTLTGSVFSGTYTTGGVAKMPMEPGGAVAAASTTNYVLVGSNNGMAYCTADGGLTWTQMTDSTLPRAWTTVTSGASAGGTSITVASASAIPTNALTVPLADGRLFYSNFSAAGNVLTLVNAVPPGTSIATSANIYSGTGWGFASYLHTRNVTVDQVAANTFYGVNGDSGLYKWTNCGSMIRVNTTTTTDSGWNGYGGAVANVTLKAVPGEQGHLFYTSQESGGPKTDHPSGNRLWRTCNGMTTTTNGMIMHQVPNMWEVYNVGFGAPKPSGAGYPSIYAVGYYDAGGVQANAVYGIWRSDNDANHGNTGVSATCTDGNTWTKISDYPSGWNIVPPNDIEGDPVIWGQVYTATTAGSFVGRFN